jgi:hypothetical protein
VREEIAAIRHAFLWLSHNPQFTPLVNTASKYAAHRMLTSCFSQRTCRNCSRCLHFLGVDIDHVGITDICEATLMSAYAEAIHDPIYSMQLATKGIQLIRQAINDIAAMPEKAEQYHKRLAKYLFDTQDKIKLLEDSLTGKDTKMIDGILKEGSKIYNFASHGAGSWLYVGLPEIMAKIKAEGIKDEARIAEIIQTVYNKWITWGRENKGKV